MSESTNDIDKSGPQLPGEVGGPSYIGGLRPVMVGDCKSAKRLLGRVLVLLQKRLVTESEAKSIGYIVNVFVGALKTHELEEKITEIEKSILSQKGGSRK